MIPKEVYFDLIPRQSIIYFVSGDEAALTVKFEGLDLSTYDSITMKVRREDGGSFSKSVTPVGSTDPESGTVEFAATDLNTGDHKAEFEFDSSGKTFILPDKYPMILRTRAQL